MRSSVPFTAEVGIVRNSSHSETISESSIINNSGPQQFKD